MNFIVFSFALFQFLLLNYSVTSVETLYDISDPTGNGERSNAPFSDIAVYDKYFVFADTSAPTTGPNFNAGGIFVYQESILGAQDWFENQVYFLTAGVNGDNYGDTSVGMYGKTIIMGSPGDDITQSFSGAVYVFTESAPGMNDWMTAFAPMKLKFASPENNGALGGDISIWEATIVAGGRTQGSSNEGAIALWSESATDARDWNLNFQFIRPVDVIANNYFGSGVDIHLENFVVGCPSQTVGGQQQSGALYIYSLVSGTDWSTLTKIDGTEWNGNLGDKVSIRDLTIAAHAPGEGGGSYNGRVHIFRESSVGAKDWASNTQILSTPAGYTDSQPKFGWNGIFTPGNGVLVAQSEYHPGEDWVYLYEPSTPGGTDQQANVAMIAPSTVGSIYHPFIIGEAIFHWGLGDLGAGLEGVMYVHTYCEGTTRYTPCDCAGTDFIGASCSTPCQNGGVAAAYGYQTGASLNGYTVYDTCNCAGTDYIGMQCTTACQGGSTNTGDFTQCDCTGLNLIGTTCQDSCNNGQANGVFTSCNCDGSGATGTRCHKDVDDCSSDPCLNDGICSDYGSVTFPKFNNEFNCSCNNTGYHGDLCEISDCASSPCWNGGRCSLEPDLAGILHTACNCSATGYDGEVCETEINECASSPCLNGGTCTDLLRAYTCDCTGTGYEGTLCSDDVDDCLSSPCQNDGVCKDKGVNDFKCTCDAFWEGNVCTDDVDDCILKGYYCENGATCTDDPVNMGDVTCTCVVEDGGFTGEYCNVPIEDACVTFNPCANGGKCALDDITNNIICDCADTGYVGGICNEQVYVSECVSSPCLNEGQCYDPSDQDDDWYCDCDNTGGYFGDVCELTACDSMPCQNDGTCTDSLGGGYTCTCTDSYSGPQCEVEDIEKVQASSSSSSSSVSDPLDGPRDEVEDKEESDDTGLVAGVVVAIIVVTFLIAFAFYMRTKKRKHDQFVMPT